MDDDVPMTHVYFSEADQGKRHTLMREVPSIPHDQHRLRGVVVLRGIAGFGDSGEAHASDMPRLNVDLPLVIEFFDKPEVVRAAIALPDDLIPDSHIVCWPAVRHDNPAPRDADHSAGRIVSSANGPAVDPTGRWSRSAAPPCGRRTTPG